MKNYEVTFIVDPVLSGDEIEATAQTYVDYLQKVGCHIVHIDKMGLRTLAYEIKRRSSGVYYCVEFQSPNGEFMDDFELSLRRDERLLRFLTVFLDKFGVKYNDDKRKGLIGKKKKSSAEAAPAAAKPVAAQAPAAVKKEAPVAVEEEAPVVTEQEFAAAAEAPRVEEIPEAAPPVEEPEAASIVEEPEAASPVEEPEAASPVEEPEAASVVEEPEAASIVEEPEIETPEMVEVEASGADTAEEEKEVQ